MIKQKKFPSPLDEEGSKNLFDDIMKHWVNPELEKRKKEGSIDDSFTFTKCLIKIPLGKPIVVDFNDKAGWIATVRKDPESSFKYGDPLHIHQINEILDVKPPMVDDKRVAFVYLHLVKGKWNAFFDFSPMHDEFAVGYDWTLGKQIASYLQSNLEDQTILVSDEVNPLLRKIGLWPAPALILYPLNKIIKQLENNDEKGATETLVKFCTPKFLEKLQSEWCSFEQFTRRKKILDEALTAHKQHLYTLSIHSLLPQVEGIVTDWILNKIPPEEKIKWTQESKTKQFQDLVLDKPSLQTYNIIVNSTIDFILNGPVLKTFTDWTTKIDSSFPNRHVVEHGRYEESLFTEENSIKLILLIDTVFHIISENE